MAAVIALKDEGSEAAAKRDGRIDTGGNARAFKDHVCTVGGDVENGFVRIGALNEMVRAEFLRDSEAICRQVYGDDLATPMATCRDHAQAHETTAIYDDAVAHSGIRHVHAIEPHGGHDKQTRGGFVNAIGQMGDKGAGAMCV